jgi:hypothetical protein
VDDAALHADAPFDRGSLVRHEGLPLTGEIVVITGPLTGTLRSMAGRW